jgi:hypothetical protein
MKRMRPRPWHRWLGLGPHQVAAVEPLGADLPDLHRCACRWAALRVRDFGGQDRPDAGELVWLPPGVYEQTFGALADPPEEPSR